jgi:predicted negative regulator of RcsB-dependent stress response
LLAKLLNTIKTSKHKAFHNLGNVFMKKKNYTEAVEAYKNALRRPSDEETRYNYALAKKK